MKPYNSADWGARPVVTTPTADDFNRARIAAVAKQKAEDRATKYEGKAAATLEREATKPILLHLPVDLVARLDLITAARIRSSPGSDRVTRTGVLVSLLEEVITKYETPEPIVKPKKRTSK